MGCGNSKDAVDTKAQGKGKAGADRNGSIKNSQKTKGGKGKGNESKTPRQPREPVNEKGYKKRIRQNLRQAATGSDIEELEQAIVLFEKNKLEDNGDHADATERLNFLYLRKELRDAILRRHPEVLNRAISRVEASEYRSELSHSLENAKRLREHLTVLDQYRHDILMMDQSTISEIRSYHHPPEGVHEVMMGTYMLLGYEEEKLSDWTDVQCLLGRYGKESLIREVRNADTININSKTSQRVLNMQSKFSLEQIRSVSNGAATFYVWNDKMANKSDQDRQQEQQPGPPQTPGKQSGKNTPASRGNSNRPQPNAKNQPQSQPKAKDQKQANVNAKDKNQQQAKAKDKNQPNVNAQQHGKKQTQPGAKNKTPSQPNSKDKQQNQPNANKLSTQPNAKDKNQAQPNTKDKNKVQPDNKVNTSQPSAKDKNPANPTQPSTKDKKPANPAQPNAKDKNTANPSQPNAKDKNQANPSQPKTKDKNPANTPQPNAKDKNTTNPAQPNAKDKNPANPAQPNTKDKNPANPAQPSTKDKNPASPSQPNTKDKNSPRPNAQDKNQVPSNSPGTSNNAKDQVLNNPGSNANTSISQPNAKDSNAKPQPDPQSTTDRNKTKG
uniref:Proteoglycan 4-like isoform X4 n=1 Tax=Crassostrea virginica TaxID=6565 RepID=A0A8B8DZQ3_CRAVI|nr:proteoglycan 4-like isoform X4 [Crassostrea virginica]